MSSECAEQKAKGSSDHVKKQIPCRPVDLFHRGTNLHQRHHVESDVDQPPVEKHRSNHSPPLIHVENWRAVARSEAILGFTGQSPQNRQASSLADGGVCKPTDAQHHQIRDQKRRGCRSFMLTEHSGKFLAKGRERKAQARAAHVASCGADADERSARGADLRTRLIVSTSAK